MAETNQFVPQLTKIVDFAIEGHPDRTVFVGNRLASRLQIDDTQTPVSQSGVHRSLAVKKVTLIVRSATVQSVIHPLQIGAAQRELGIGPNTTGNSTHADNLTLTKNPLPARSCAAADVRSPAALHTKIGSARPLPER